MKLDFDSVKGRISVVKHPNCKILRHIYHFGYEKYCLIRIYEFQTKTIVIASQLSGAILWDMYIISNIVRKFNLNYIKLVWINHIGLFSDFRPTKEEFIHTIVLQPKSIFPFTSSDCELCETKEIDLQTLERLIESKLEPVEAWLGLSNITLQKRKEEYKKNNQKLLHLYLQQNLDIFAQQIWLRKILSQALIGSVFLYPEAQNLQFLRYTDLENSNNDNERLALPYVEKYNPVTEMVVCVCTNSGHTYCGILSKSFFKKY